jgi:hypothetical protein
VREERGGVAREPEAGQRGRVVLGNRGRREKKGGEGKRKEKKREGKKRKKIREGKEKRRRKKGKWGKRKGKREMVEGKKREKGRKRGDARWRYSRRRPRLVGHARATFARCARKKGGIASALIAERRSRVVDRPPSGAGWDSGQVRCRSSGWRGKMEGVRARALMTNGF